MFGINKKSPQNFIYKSTVGLLSISEKGTACFLIYLEENFCRFIDARLSAPFPLFLCPAFMLESEAAGVLTG